jgi:heterodisulfide reductase subunit C
MMDTRDRRSRKEILMPIKVFYSDNKTLLNDYITGKLWACTSCNACGGMSGKY